MYLMQRDPEPDGTRVVEHLTRLLADPTLAPMVRLFLEEALRRARIEILLARRGVPDA